MSGPSLSRVDAREKVTGVVRYGADRLPDGVLHAALAVSTIAVGRVAAVHTDQAQRCPGVRLVLTHPLGEELKSAGFVMGGGHGFQSLQPLTDDRIAYRGQPIALVVADTPHEAAEAARLISADYEPQAAAVLLNSDGTETVDQQTAIPMPMLADIVHGDADEAFRTAHTRVDLRYDCPPQHPAPMEMIGSVVEWNGDRLTIHEGTQNANALRFGVATQLGLDPQSVRVSSPYIGGAFGNKNSLQPHTALAAIAARRLGRPVKLVLTRTQMFLGASFRPASRHRVRLGADADGLLVAAIHEVDQQTSRHDLFPANYTDMTARLYGVNAFRGHQRLVRTDVQTPGYMRTPHEHPAAFAFESAVDELAYAWGQDPVALRLANDTQTDPITGHPFSSRFLADCLRQGAERFGWSRRTPQPGSMTADDGSAIGWGVAIGAYPCSNVPAITRLRADASGSLLLHVGGHEMGQGIRTAITETVITDLGVPADRVHIDLGDTAVVPQPLTAGAWGTATALPGVHDALAALRGKLGVTASGPVDVAAAVRALGGEPIEVETVTLGPGQNDEAVANVRRGALAIAGPDYPGFVTFSYVAHFIEVRVEPITRRVRVTRTVSIADCGRVASPVTAASQMRGGVIWGISAALRELSDADPRHGGFLNADLADYVIAVNADIPDLDVGFVNRPDPRLNALGVKSLGEVAMAGVAPAVANAIYHATGTRHRHLPIRLEDML
ncbi:xanthine dehydrogenase family protein molybdopterin-binding subunit [Micromonospora sp. 067-2]|uniref:xanthine dehydrogenase family protein molybdopterin-binding subunit n=1 Tax=Micromonospora sp. 067-2 TaxID=2789270 RepID=UPI00397A8969